MRRKKNIATAVWLCATGTTLFTAEIPKERLPTAEELSKWPVVTPEKTASILKEVSFPPEFEVSVFATAPAVNYPVFLAAAPEGTLYVSSDGNGSIDRKPNRGRILRVRDTNNDGQADEVKVFVSDVDSPRGLVWDHDRLYVLHPPHLSVFIDKNGDGISDEQKVLVKNIAFTFKDRPADHSSNGLELGVDGWIYAAIGDFGFMEAEGIDGKKLQMWNGGVVRVRPDGTGLEEFARGTRNILEVAVSPLLDGFARDNTNDGGGWDIRFHHFSGMTDHGYPRLFKNFPNEVISPVAIYGGGSGCGAAWVDETGLPTNWNNAPFTADWGRDRVYYHKLTPSGATFSDEQKEFCKISRPTDLDVDAFGNIYVASWKGATFTWNGNDVGYIVRARPKGAQPEALPNFEKATEGELVKLLESTSHRRRLEAQRTLARRNFSPELITLIEKLAANENAPLSTRVAAIFCLKQALGAKSHFFLSTLANDPTIASWALRALTDHKDQLANVPMRTLRRLVNAGDPRIRKEAVISLARLGQKEFGSTVAYALSDPDPIVVHTAVESMVKLQAWEAALELFDNPRSTADVRTNALRVVQQLPYDYVVGAMAARYEVEKRAPRKAELFSALCRLYYREGEWRGESWGTRPDTRGPYYKPTEWSETRRIDALIRSTMETAEGTEAGAFVAMMAKHRIPLGPTLERTFEMAENNSAVLDAVLSLYAESQTAPPNAVPFFARVAADPQRGKEQRLAAFRALLRIDDPEAMDAALAGFDRISFEDGDLWRKVSDAFLGSRATSKFAPILQQTLLTGNGNSVSWSAAAVMRNANRRGADELKTNSIQTLDLAWQNQSRREHLLRGMLIAGDSSRAVWALESANSSEPGLKKLGEQVVRELKLQPNPKGPAEPKLGELDWAAAVNSVVNLKGDSARGLALYNQLGCNACHTTKKDEPLKGPFLGNIAKTYKRKELAEAILKPDLSIAQGFASHRFELADGSEVEGFVTLEAADAVTVRTILAQEMKIPAKDIAKREKLSKSLMPEGLVAEITRSDLAHLISYLESLADQEK